MANEAKISTILNLGTTLFAVLWIGLIVSAAATIPVVGFAVAVPAALVAYAVRAAVTGSAKARVEANEA